jgi:hypothetical protein
MAAGVSRCLLVGTLALFTLFTICPCARAVVLLHDQFQEDGVLNGKTPMPGPGANWNSGSATGINSVTVTNGEAVLIQTEPVNGEDIANIFADQTATSTTYARFDFRLPALENATLATDPDAATGVFFVSLRAAGASALRARTGVLPPAAGGGYRFAINADSSDLSLGAAWPTDLAFDTTYRAVISFNAATDASQLWINPVDMNSTSVTHAGTNAAAIGTIINRIILRQNNDYEGKQFVDNVVVGTTFAEVLNPPSAGVPGDYNANGLVDAADYVIWRKNSGTAFQLTNEVAGTTPGQVTTDDYDAWRARFGNTSGSGLGAASVPEPSAALIAICFLGAGVMLRRSASR